MRGDARRVVGLLWPAAAELLERGTSEQQRILCLGLLAQHRLDVGVVDVGLVSGRCEPSLGRLDHTSTVTFSVTTSFRVFGTLASLSVGWNQPPRHLGMTIDLRSR